MFSHSSLPVFGETQFLLKGKKKRLRRIGYLVRHALVWSIWSLCSTLLIFSKLDLYLVDLLGFILVLVKIVGWQKTNFFFRLVHQSYILVPWCYQLWKVEDNSGACGITSMIA